jgi:hypothetical protein
VLASPKANSVYPIFVTAARHWLAGEDLYQPVAELYRYSPFVATLMIPFSLLPETAGGVLWRLLNAGVFLGALGWWGLAVLPRPLTQAQMAGLFLLVVPLSIGSLNNGQSNALVLGLLLAATAAVARGRDNLAAASVALVSLFKVYPLAVGLLLALVAGRRFASRLGVALLCGLALPFLLQHPAYVLSQYEGWYQHLLAADRQSLPPELWYRDLRLLCHTWHVPLGITAYLVVELAAGVAFAVICRVGRAIGRGPRLQLTTLLALGCCWMTLFGPATESSTYILLAPSLAWAVMEAWLLPRSFAIRAGLLASYGLFVVTLAAVWFPGGGRAFHALGPHPLAALLFLICVLGTEVSALHTRKTAAAMETSQAT